ncbi:MAG: alkaline phosphatase D family protein [Chloroflexota bacterium]
MAPRRFLTFSLLFLFSLFLFQANLRANPLSYVVPELDTTFVAKTAVWSYYDLGQTPPDDASGDSWFEADYDASNWPGSGAAPLGYGDGHVTTTIGFGPDASHKYRTSYFQHSFNVADASTIQHLILNLLRDDGAIVYLNGVEVVRSNMPAGAVNSNTFATTATANADETTYFSFTINPNLLQNGTNVLAVEVHQATNGSSDKGFDLELVGSDALIPSSAVWKYLDDGSNQGTAWQASGFNDSSWASGNAQLGYGDSDETTVVSYGPDPDDKYPTTYFRHTFNVADVSGISFLKFKFVRDDGIVIYLNGTEVVRDNMPSGSIDYETFASSTVSNSAEDAFFEEIVAASGLLVNGNNTVAVEIHQRDADSSDLSFDLELEIGQINEFVQSIWSGAITPTSAKVNAKIAIDSATVRLVVSESSDLSNPMFSSFVTADQATNNRVAALSIAGLAPGTTYYYGIEAEGVVDTNKTGKFKTFVDGSFTYTFAFSGDATMGSEHPVFTTIADLAPDFFLNPGDLFYADIGVNDRDLFRDAYDATLDSAPQSYLYQNVPISHMWDDHDYGPNNSDSSAPGREAARLTYQEYMPHYPLAAGSGNVAIYQSYSVGRAKFILTDLRSERDSGANTMMGATQKAWFKQELLDAKDKYPLIFWLSSVPWISSSSSDTWDGFSSERTEIANFIKDNGIEGIIIVSADAHMLALDDGTNSDYATGGGAAMPVFHAAALDRGGSTKGGPYTHGPFADGGQFAMITVTDTGDNQICVNYSGIRREDGSGLLTELIDFDTCFTAVPDATPPQVTAGINSNLATSLDLSWMSETDNCGHEIHESPTPYFPYDGTTLIQTLTNNVDSTTVTNALGSAEENHFYKVVAVNCNEMSTAVSNHIGAFDFSVTPGSS